MKKPARWYREWYLAYIKTNDERPQGIADCLGFALLVGVMALLSLALMCTLVQADECQNPETLSPKLKKAYYELQDIAKDVKGMTVSIRCRKIIVQEGETNANKETAKRK